MRTESGIASWSESSGEAGLFTGMHCEAVLVPIGATAKSGAAAAGAAAAPSIVAVPISETTSETTVFARLSAWAWETIGVAGAVPWSVLQALTPIKRTSAAPASANRECSTVRIRATLQAAGVTDRVSAGQTRGRGVR